MSYNLHLRFSTEEDRDAALRLLNAAAEEVIIAKPFECLSVQLVEEDSECRTSYRSATRSNA